MGVRSPSSLYPGGTDVFDGALVHASREFPEDFKSALIDPHPAPSPKAAFSALKAGESFTDPLNGTQVTVLSKDPSGLTLDVQLGVLGSITTDIQSPQRDQIFNNPRTLTIQATAATPIGKIKKVTFSLGAREDVLGTDTASPFKKTINVKNVPAGKHWIWVTAYDAFGYSAFKRVRIEIKR